MNRCQCRRRERPTLSAAVSFSGTASQGNNRGLFPETQPYSGTRIKPPLSESFLFPAAMVGIDYRERAAALHGPQYRIASQGDDDWPLRAVEEAELAH